MAQDNKQQKVITEWSTKKVEEYEIDRDSGVIQKDSPYQYGNVHLRKPYLLYNYTKTEIEELVKCKNDVKYFANHYAYTQNPSTGSVTQITLRDYQEDLLDTLVTNRYTIILSARQSGKTVSSSLFLGWAAAFNFDKTIFICANKEKTAKDVMSKVMDVIKNLPFFMKPGIIKWSSLECVFDNGCRIIAESTTPRSGIGFTIHYLYLDEFAHVEKGIIDEFFDNIYPTVTAVPDGRIIITSTPNGQNRFFQLYDAAVKGKNSFTPFRIDWWQVPDWDNDKKMWVKRDEAWAEQKIADLGGTDRELGETRFAAQYGNSFLATGNLLLGPKALEILHKSMIPYEKKPQGIFERYNVLEGNEIKWHPDIDPEEVSKGNGIFLFSVDTAEGGGGDNSVINIFQMFVLPEEKWDNILSPTSLQDFVGLRQIGVFADNTIHLRQFAKMLYILSHLMFNPDNVRILLEWNAFGGEVFSGMENAFGDSTDFFRMSVLHFKRDANNPTAPEKPGLRIGHENKNIYCQDCRKHITNGRLVITNPDTVEDFQRFGRVRESWAAIAGHDDEAMTCVNANAFFKHRDFGWLSELVLDAFPDISRLTDYYYNNRTIVEI